MAQPIVDFYDELADELGVSRSYVMVMALKTYMDQQKTMDVLMSPGMNDLFKITAKKEK